MSASAPERPSTAGRPAPGGEPRDELTVMVAGQGGDGSLTIITLLSRALLRRGYSIYGSNNIASRIKGGHAAGFMRASARPRSCLGERIDILVAFDLEAVHRAAPQLAPDGVVIFDSSRDALPPDLLPETVMLLPVPFSRLAVRDLRRELFKNSLGFGLLGRIVGLPDAEVEGCLRGQLGRLSGKQFEPNLRGLRAGQAMAEEAGIVAERPLLVLRPRRIDGERLFISGNHAVALGFMAAGGRFFAGYPITPATDVMNFLSRHLPAVGGIVIQAEDELAAANLAIGAALTGVGAMTASSGPGIALMQESIGHCGSAEIPLVIVDCQRAGPSTGMPTKREQSDVNLLTRGGNGDFPHVVLAPGDPAECFEYGVLALNVARRAQCPVVIALDAVCHDSFTVPRFDLGSVSIDHGRRLQAGDVARLPEYRRYEITDDGISPWAVPGTPGAMSLVTGNERDEWGRVTTDPAIRVRMVDKRDRKIEAVRAALPGAVEWGDADSPVGIVCLGMLGGVLAEAREILSRRGCRFRCHRPRTLWPVPAETVAFVNSHERVYVIEQNKGAQLARLLQSAGAEAARIVSILQYDGLPFNAGQMVEMILAKERAT